VVKNVRELFESSTAGYKAAPDPVTGFILTNGHDQKWQGQQATANRPEKMVKRLRPNQMEIRRETQG
jgi:hypothetical protein